jgi:hypothetical protein
LIEVAATRRLAKSVAWGCCKPGPVWIRIAEVDFTPDKSPLSRLPPVDDLFVGHRGCVTTSPFRFLPEERGIGRSRGIRQRFIHVDLNG